MFMHKSKKGFTIVELVIVIAVIAILAAVLIPTFSNLIKRANESNDQQMVRNMNTVLATYTDTEKEISDIMAYLRSNGFSYEKMVTYSKGYHYCYAKSTNSMYLLDDNNEVVFPKDAQITKDELWSAYKDHATYVVPGISHYYAISAVTNQTEFNSAFTETGYVLDLNDNVCTVTGNGNVSVENGFVTKTGFANSDDVVTVKESVKTSDNEEEINTWIEGTEENKTKVTYKNVLNPDGIESTIHSSYADNCTIEYIGCVFTTQPGFYQNGQSFNLKFIDCTFVNYGGFALQLHPYGTGKTSTVTFEKCDFVNTDRGINIGWKNTTVTIKDCNFALKTGNSANNCLQISNYANDTELADIKVNFTGNTVASANGVVYFHNEMTGPQDLDTFKGVLNFSGNTYAEGVAKIADRGEYEEGHLLYNNDTAKNQLAALIK